MVGMETGGQEMNFQIFLEFQFEVLTVMTAEV